MTGTQALLVAALAVPLALAFACLSRSVRACAPWLLVLVPLPAIAASLLAVDTAPLVLPRALLRVTLVLDLPGAMLLGAAALLWSAAGAYALRYPVAHRASFTVLWLLTLTGNLGVFIAADLTSFYLFFAMASLSAYGLVVHDRSERAWRAGTVYVALALLGEAFVLAGLVLLAAGTAGDSLLIRDAVAALTASPSRSATLAFLIAGFGLKIGLVPVHVWMPLAYPAAPLPAAAVLSGAAVKTGVIGLIRFLPLDTALPEYGGVLVVVGLFSAFYGVAVGLTQSNPKAILAYSSVSQMGLIAAVLGMGLSGGQGASTISGTALYAAHHVLVKGASFLAIGVVVAASGTCRLRSVILVTALVALSLAGLPLTGGAAAKLAVKTPLGDGIVGALASLSAAGTTLLMLHFVRRLMLTDADRPVTSQPGLALPWLMTVVASVAVAWGLYPLVGSLAEAFSLKELWAALWPVALGGMLAVGLQGWAHSLPRIPEGDIVVAGETAVRGARVCGSWTERVDARLREWPVAGLSLLALAIALWLTMLGAR